MRNGGIVSMANLIAIYVEPQIKYRLAKANIILKVLFMIKFPEFFAAKYTVSAQVYELILPLNC